MRYVQRCFIWVPIVFAGCSGGSEEFCENTSARNITQDSATRQYVITVPDSYDGSSSLPLVLGFHGNGGCADDLGAESDLNSLVNAQNFILVYPQGLLDDEGMPGWRPTADSSQSIQDNDFVFVEQVIADVSNQYNVNSEQVYAVGISNGGMMAYGLACRRSNLVAAIGVMSGTMLTDTCTSDAYTSVIHFHGTADTIVTLEGNQGFPSVTGSIEYWVSQNNTMTSPTTEDLDNGNVLREIYSGGNEETEVELYTIQNGYHVWFDDDIGGQSPNQIMWDFVSQYTLGGRADGATE